MHVQTIAEKFLAGDMEVDEFLEQFLTRRKLMHLRKVKVDKLRELIKQSHFATGGPGYPISTNFPGMAPSIPYPTGPVSMPMPVPSGLSYHRPYWITFAAGVYWGKNIVQCLNSEISNIK